MPDARTDHWTCYNWVKGFPSACARAAIDDSLFCRFRSEPSIAAVVETRPAAWIDLFLSRTKQASVIDMDAAMTAAAKLDRIGSPALGDWNGHRISGNAAAYVCTYAQIVGRFGSLANMRIAELGVGYGGQASIICQCEPVKEYALFDYQGVTDLAKRVCKETCPSAPITTPDLEQCGEFDLFISCCALSELTPEGAASYVPLMSNSRLGYLVWSITPYSSQWARTMTDALQWLIAAMPSRNVHTAHSDPAMPKAFEWWFEHTLLWNE